MLPHTARLHKVWREMWRRCSQPECSTFAYYGGRGIQVCERWEDFDQFVADIGDRPTPRHSLERTDNEGNYEPGNVKWATRKEQANNVRSNRWHTHNGETLTVAQWADRIGVNYHTVRMRILRGRPVDQDRTHLRGRKSLCQS